MSARSYTVAKAISYTLLTVPRRLYEMFGYAALIGGLLGLGGLAGTGELTALRAAGLSKLRICVSVVITLFALTLCVAVLGETLAAWEIAAPRRCRWVPSPRTSPWPRAAACGRVMVKP